MAPYETVYRKAEVFLRHGGVTVYETYSDDDKGANSASSYQFTINPQGGEEDEGAFDVRELRTWKEPKHPPYLSGEGNTLANRVAWDKYHTNKVEEKAAVAAIREAIDLGIIPAWAKEKKR